MHEVKQVVFNASDFNLFTCFDLAFNESILNDFTELGSIQNFGPDDELELKPKEYGIVRK